MSGGELCITCHSRDSSHHIFVIIIVAHFFLVHCSFFYNFLKSLFPLRALSMLIRINLFMFVLSGIFSGFLPFFLDFTVII